MQEDVETADGPIIPEEDFREAIAACRQDPELDRYFKFAPRGARLFVGLSFYSTYFGEKTDTAQYQACLAEIEPALQTNDLKYLLRFERDRETKKYLRELMAKREAEEAAAEAPPAAEASAAPEAPHAPRAPAVQLHGLGNRLKGLQLVADAETSAPRPLLLPGLIGAGILALFGFFFLLQAHVKTSRALEQARAETAALGQRMQALQHVLDRTESALKQLQDDVRKKLRAPQPRLPDAAPRETVPDAPVQTATPHEDAPAPVPPPSETPRAQQKDAPVKVVFTDGRSIVRRQNGKHIEVPRRFSYAGAGLKKPFWIYDGKLDEAKMEAEARQEKQARATWRALADEARRQDSARRR